jgi:hypothetical protein
MKCIVLLELAAYSIDNHRSRTMLNMNTCDVCAVSSQVFGNDAAARALGPKPKVACSSQAGTANKINTLVI